MRIVVVIAFCIAAGWGVVSFFALDKPAPAAVAQNVDHRKPMRLPTNAGN
jgi:hypothetical protein